ncbi:MULTISPECIES: copper resistance CopC family protein [Methylocaldum]|jgi:methionine-rich copper-binding protein CopC|uniref:copper resistance CopC family protein n=2 Tax=Methylocaldum TaxID=73778 RepID=UPI0010EB1883|nr:MULTISPECIES: copper resistance CopC family protein [unclassified Methylocaldum]MBP1149613.1 methionine-rich copper-binding protein CopC [Methylocaldum sp. RMAD-M]
MHQPLSSRSRKFAVLLFSMSLLLAYGQRPWAHAVVTESSLTQNPIQPNHATTVVLFFNSNVELPLSRVFLVSKGDVFHPVQIEKGKKPGEMRIQVPALTPGEYALKYKVFAADGHFTENVIRFHVSEPR